MGKILSIIIPAFNVEPYVEKCLRSCVEQDIPSSDYEIIVVNDGSTDNSIKVIEKVVSEYSNFKIINKANGGVSSARNVGIDTAQGTYLWFVDSDDWIEKNCLSRIISLLQLEELDALQIGYFKVNGTNILTCDKKFLITTPILTPQKYVTPDLFIGGACGTIFKRDLVIRSKIRFDEELKLSEDQLFFLELFKYSDRIKRENILTYYYLSNPNSAIHNISEDEICKSIQKIAKFDFFDEFEDYCKYLITVKFFLYLNLPKKNIFKLNKIVKPFIRRMVIKYYERNSRERIILYLYSYFGLGFLILYSSLSILKKFISTRTGNKFTSIFKFSE